MNEHDEWEAKHRARRTSAAGEPDPFVCAALDHLGKGQGRTAWDLAAGRGRHALELARRGFDVTAFDRSPEALEQLASHARAEGSRIRVEVCDLEAGDALHGSARADLIVVVNYLDRELFDRLPAFLRPGGRLLIATYTEDRTGDHPSDRWCLRRGELAVRFEGARIELGEERGGRAGVLARFGESLASQGELNEAAL